MENTVAAYGIYANAVELIEVVRTLNGAGFKDEHMCLILAPTHPIASILRDANLPSHEREASTVTVGLIDWISQFGAVVIPSVGFFIRSQAFFHALLAARNAPALCGNSRTLAGLGFPDGDASRLEAHLQRTGFLVYIASPEIGRVRWAVELFRISGAEECATLETEADAAVA